MVNFLCSCRKLCLTSSVDDMNLCTETESCSRCVHRYVSTADNSNFLTSSDRCVIIVAERLHQVASCEVLIRGKYAVRVLARDSHESRKTGTGIDEDSLVTLFVHQLIHRYRLADNYVCLDINAELLHILDLRLYNALFRETELRDTVG